MIDIRLYTAGAITQLKYIICWKISVVTQSGQVGLVLLVNHRRRKHVQ